MRIGARIIKTALSVVICLLIASFLDESTGLYAAIAAIITIQSTFSYSYLKGKERILGTFFGAFVGYIFASIPINDLLLVGIGIVLIIYVCNMLKWDTAPVISCVVFLAIMTQANMDIFEYSLFRLIDTTSGIVIALLINYFVLPYKPLSNVYNKCKEIFDELTQYIDEVLFSNRKINLDDIYEKIIELRQKSDINDMDVRFHHESEGDIKKLRLVIDGLQTIYEHLVFVEQFKEYDKITIPSLPEDTIQEKKLPEIFIEFHSYQILKKWDRVKSLLEELPKKNTIQRELIKNQKTP